MLWGLRGNRDLLMLKWKAFLITNAWKNFLFPSSPSSSFSWFLSKIENLYNNVLCSHVGCRSAFHSTDWVMCGAVSWLEVGSELQPVMCWAMSKGYLVTPNSHAVAHWLGKGMLKNKNVRVGEHLTGRELGRITLELFGHRSRGANTCFSKTKR